MKWPWRWLRRSSIEEDAARATARWYWQRVQKEEQCGGYWSALAMREAWKRRYLAETDLRILRAYDAGMQEGYR